MAVHLLHLLEHPFYFPPHPIPLACPSALTLSALFHALNLEWSSISHMVIYMFQCYSLKWSNPHLLPWSPKVSSLSLCLFCCLAYRVIITIFLNSIYMDQYTVLVFFSFWLPSLCIIDFRFIHLTRTDSNYILFNSWVIFHCAYVPQLSYPFICRWSSRLLPCPGCCKKCCDEHWDTHVSFNSGFLGVYAQQWHCWAL